MSDDNFCDDNTTDENGIIVQFFDLQDPLSRFKSLLEQLWHVSLADYTIWLQGTQQLSEDKSLIEHGVEGEGQVQIKLEIRMRKDGIKMINIVDVLKPTDEEGTDNVEEDNVCDESKNAASSSDKSIQWVESKEFVIEKLRYGIPSDPKEWNEEDVRRWIMWAIKTFNLKDVNLNDWDITGNEICQITVDEYKKKIPRDPSGNFWTHLQVLQKCGQVAISLEQEDNNEKASRVTKVFYNNKVSFGNVNLWRFLLELLTEKTYVDIIRWISDNGEFQILKPDTVAQLWGKKKQKGNMTYEKLSRALRYYYDGNMISKVIGKKYVYKFHCDIKEVIGYSPMELNKLLNEN